MTINADTTVTVTFAALYTVSVKVNGKGTVSANGESCPPLCSGDVPAGSSFLLTATPGAGQVLTGWSGGGCAGSGSTCSVTINADTTVTVTFAAPPPPPPPTDDAGTSTQSDSTQTDEKPSSGSITIPTKQTPLQKPPQQAKAAPPKYGVIANVRETRAPKVLTVVFRFSRAPVAGATIRATWYYNNEKLGQARKKRRLTVSTGVRSNVKLKAGYWRIALEVKLGGGPWHTVKEARVLLK